LSSIGLTGELQIRDLYGRELTPPVSYDVSDSKAYIRTEPGITLGEYANISTDEERDKIREINFIKLELDDEHGGTFRAEDSNRTRSTTVDIEFVKEYVELPPIPDIITAELYNTSDNNDYTYKF